MNILTKYTLKEFFPPFFLALICFTSILLFDEVFRLTKHFVKKGINPYYLIELLIYLLPVVIVLTIPMATLVGILLALGRLSTDNEVTAMKAHGLGFHQILLPLILTATFLSVFDFVFMDYSLPRGNAAYFARKRDISMRNPAFVLEEGVVMRELEREQKLWMYESMDPRTKRLQDVRVWDSIWGGRPRFIHAKEATIGFEEDGQAWLALYNGTTYETASDDLQGFRVTAFDRQRVALDFTETLERNKYSAERPKGMSIAGLKDYIKKKSEESANAKEGSYVIEQLRDAQAEYHKRFSIPFACLAFGLIGVPLGLIVKRSGKMVGFGVGLGLILVYYLLLQFGQGWVGRNSVISPGFAMWIPNIVIGTLGVGFSLHALLGERLQARIYRQEIVTSTQRGADAEREGESN